MLRGREVSGSTQEAGTAVTAGEVPQLKLVSGRHSDTRKRPVRSGYSVANPKALQYCPGPPVCLPAKQVPMFHAGGGKAASRGRVCILVSSNFGRAIAIMIRDSAFRRYLIADCCYC